MAKHGLLGNYRFTDAAEDIRGSKLYGLNDEKLGKIDDVIFDHFTGLIHYAHGGFRAISIPGSPPAHIEALARARMVVFGSSPETS